MITKVTRPDQLQLHDGLTMWTFSAPHCVPCKLMNPLMDKVAGNSDKIHIYRIDCTQNVLLAQAYNINTVPTVLVYYNKRLKHILHSLAGVKHELETAT